MELKSESMRIPPGSLSFFFFFLLPLSSSSALLLFSPLTSLLSSSARLFLLLFLSSKPLPLSSTKEERKKEEEAKEDRIHVDVQQLRPVLHLLKCHGQGIVVLVLLDEPLEAQRASNVATLADVDKGNVLGQLKVLQP